MASDEYKAAINAAANKRIREREALGLCSQCQMPAAAGRKKCQRHMDMNAAAVARYSVRRKAALAERHGQST